MDRMPTAPLTPSKHKQIEEFNQKIEFIVGTSLNFNWDLNLPIPKPGESPSRREATVEQQIVSKIKALTFKGLIEPLIQRFCLEAQILYTGWINKPKGERGVIPERTRHTGKKTVRPEERAELYTVLLGILDEKWQAMTPKKNKNRALSSSDLNNPMGSAKIDDSPLRFPRLSKAKNDGKRPHDQTVTGTVYKKPRIPSPKISTASFPNTSNIGRSDSFVSNAPSTASSVFSNYNKSNQSLSEISTQETVLTQPLTQDEEGAVDMKYRDDPETSFEVEVSSSNYEANSSFDAALVASVSNGQGLVGVAPSDPVVDEELSQDLLGQAAIDDDDEDLYEISEFGEAELKKKLKGIFRE
jgi:hypothetical protein